MFFADTFLGLVRGIFLSKINNYNDSCAGYYYENGDEYIVLSVIMIPIGVLCYCAMPIRIHASWSLFLIITLFACFRRAIFLIIPILCLIVGLLCADLRHITSNIDTRCKDINGNKVNISGSINSISYGSRSSVILDKIYINREYYGCKVRLPISQSLIYKLRTGHTLSFNGNIYVPKKIYHKSDKDFIEKLTGNTLKAKTTSAIKYDKKGFSPFESMRSHIAKKIHDLQLKEDSDGYGIIAALTIGTTGYIENELLDNIRRSGFAHLFAISGLHVGIIIGAVFLMFRYMMSRLEHLCLNYNINKISSFLSIIFGLLYLNFAGYGVSIQRSIAMASLVFVAIIIDRKPSSMRVWSCALLIIVLFYPEKIFMPSMQMSFIATFALISLYGKWLKMDESPLIVFFIKKQKMLSYVIMIMVSSLVAGFVTSFYEIYHFNQLSIIGLISNEVAIPLVEFIILPLSMLGVLFSYLNITDFILRLSGFFGEWLAWFASYFGSYKLGCFYTKPMPGFLILTISLGIIYMFNGSKNKASGLFIICISSCLYVVYPGHKVIYSNVSQTSICKIGNFYYSNKEIKNDFELKVLKQFTRNKNIIFNDKECNPKKVFDLDFKYMFEIL